MVQEVSLRRLLEMLVKGGEAHVVLGLATGSRKLQEVLPIASSKYDVLLNEHEAEQLSDALIRDTALEVFGEYKCKGRHFWIVRKQVKAIDEQTAVVPMFCNSCNKPIEVKVDRRRAEELLARSYVQFSEYVKANMS